MKTDVNAQCAKVGRVSEELHSVLGDEFEVSFSDSRITLYNNIDEYILSKKEVYQLLQDAGVELRYCIVDENQQYVWEHSIKLVNKRNKEYTYTSYPKVERCYSNIETVKGILNYLQFMNQCAKMNHVFNIEVFTAPAPKDYAIVDQYGHYVDSRSITLTVMEDNKTACWQYCSYSTIVNSVWYYSSLELAEGVLDGLNKLKVIAGYSGIKFHIEELKRYSTQDSKASRIYLPIPKGHKIEHKKLYREYVKQYL